MRDIAILNLTRFGDLIQTTPVLAGLRRRHPEAKIHLIVKRRFRSVAQMLPAVDAIHEIDGDALAQTVSLPGIPFVERFRRVREVVDSLAKLRFDTVLNFTHSRASAVLLSLLGAERVIGYTLDRHGHRFVGNAWLSYMATLVRTRRLSRVNLVEVYLGAAGVLREGTALSVRIPESSRALARERLPGSGPLLAVQLGASQSTKTWSLQRFAHTLSHLARRIPELRVVLVGVRSEAEAARTVMEQASDVRFENLVGKTELDELAAILERCDALLTGDTGTMHLAAAVGTTTCSVFVGLGMPYETAVYAEGHWAVMSRLACAPCGHHVQCGHTVCHEDIPSEWLADLLHRILRREAVENIPSLPRADLLRTRFDTQGLFDLAPVHRRAPQPHDLLALAYRALFLETLEGFSARPEETWRRAAERFGVERGAWSGFLPEGLAGNLARLGEFARNGERLAQEIESRPRERATLASIGKRLREVDQQIYAVARSQPLLAPLGFFLEGSLEDLPDLDIAALAALSRRHYGTLRRQVELLTELIAFPLQTYLSIEGART